MPFEENIDPGFPADRRDFFRRGLARLVEPLAGYIETSVNLTGMRLYLRPPGALPERQFLDTCYRCGNCVEACPVQAIKQLRSLDDNLARTPTIDPNEQACVACETVACTQVCPSGALRKLTDPRHIRMGLAFVDHKRCLRPGGEDCTICIDKCPIGADALRLDEQGRIEVREAGCTGCGVCQMECPTKPKAIVVELI